MLEIPKINDSLMPIILTQKKANPGKDQISYSEINERIPNS